MSGVQGGCGGSSGEIPQGDVVVGDGDTVAVRNSQGADSHNGTSVVDPGPPAVLEGINLGSATTMIDNGDAVPITRTDGTGSPLSTSSARVANGSLGSVSVPANVAVVHDEQDALNIEQFDSSGTFGGIARVSANVLTMQLANATTRILVDQLPIDVKNSAGTETVSGTLGIDLGALEGVSLPDTIALVANNDTVPVGGQSGAASVAGGELLDVSLPGSMAVVTNGQSIGILSAVLNSSRNLSVTNGVLQDINLAPSGALIGASEIVTVKTDSGGVSVPLSALLLNVTTGVIDQVKLPVNWLPVTNGTMVEVENIAENQAASGPAMVNVNDTLSVHLPAGVALIANNSAIQVPVTGTYIDTITPQVDVNGNITGFVLS